MAKMLPMIPLVCLLVLTVYCASSEPQISSQQAQLVYQYLIFQKSCIQKYNETGLTKIPIECAVYTLSQIFNIILIPLCLVLRVPQILLIWKNRSVFGLSYIGNNFELLMTSMTLAYGLYARFSFWIYGENILLSLQNIVIISMFFWFPSATTQEDRAKQRRSLVLPLTLTTVTGLLFVLQLVPDWCQQLSIWLQLVVFFMARGSQIYNNYKYKTTQNLSAKTMGITLFANVARTITILVQAPHSIGYLLNYLIPIFVNGTIVAQIYLYSKQSPFKQI